MALAVSTTSSLWVCVNRPTGKRVSSVMEGGHVVMKRESMGCRFKGELKALVERIHSTEVKCVLNMLLAVIVM